MNDKTNEEKEINPGPMGYREPTGEITIIDPVMKQRDHNMKLMELAITSGANMDSLEKLMDLQERWEAGIARKSFYQALPKFQSQLPVINKRGLASFEHRNGGGKTEYSYAKLEDITEAIKPFLVENGLSYRYEQNNQDGGMICVTCIITHADGHEERTEMSSYADQSGKKNPIQQIASTVSYLRRYTLTGALGITVSDEDDDGAGAAEQTETGEPQGDYYSAEQFTKMFPFWSESIQSGKNTVEKIFAYLQKKNVNLSQEQITKINNIGK